MITNVHHDVSLELEDTLRSPVLAGVEDDAPSGVTI